MLATKLSNTSRLLLRNVVANKKNKTKNRSYSIEHFYSKFSISSRTSPRRGLLYVPSHEERFLKKIPNLKVDSVVLDCEDGVSTTMKDAARVNARDFLPEIVGKIRGEVCVRVNAVGSGIMEEDLECVLSGKVLPDTIVLPKVQTHQELEAFSRILTAKLQNKQKVNLLIIIETAVGLMNIRRILEAGVAYSATPLGRYKLEGVIFGSDDFVASIGAERTKESHGLGYAREKIIAYTKAFSMQAIDKVFNEFDDPVTLQKESVSAYQIGFNGKQLIHPDQIDIVQKAFTPKQARITWALELIEEFEKHSKEGKGAFRFRGQMIDMPLLRQAKNIQAINELIDRNNST